MALLSQVLAKNSSKIAKFVSARQLEQQRKEERESDAKS
jgi:hypothetical protein